VQKKTKLAKKRLINKKSAGDKKNRRRTHRQEKKSAAKKIYWLECGTESEAYGAGARESLLNTNFIYLKEICDD
jgi:hypothetical protein